MRMAWTYEHDDTSMQQVNIIMHQLTLLGLTRNQHMHQLTNIGIHDTSMITTNLFLIHESGLLFKKVIIIVGS